jgi:hypothetical protein
MILPTSEGILVLSKNREKLVVDVLFFGKFVAILFRRRVYYYFLMFYFIIIMKVPNSDVSTGKKSEQPSKQGRNCSTKVRTTKLYRGIRLKIGSTHGGAQQLD